MDLGLAGQTALITAASGGIGFSIAERLLAEGATVVISSRKGRRLEEAAERLALRSAPAGARVLTVPADLTDPDGGTYVVEKTLEQVDRLDILVSNTPGPRLIPVVDTTDEDWETAYRTLLRPAVQLSRSAAKHMVANGSGSLIFITSTWVRQPMPGAVLSASMRSGISALCKQMSIELAAHGLRVNQVMPGVTDTNRIRTLAANQAQRNDTSPTEELKRIAAAVPLNRLARPQELADAVAFLASPRSGFTTGQALAIDGGSTKGTF